MTSCADFPATTNAAYLQDLKHDFDVLYAEADLAAG